MTVKIIICGNLGQNAELRSCNNGDNVLSFSVAGSSGYGQNKQTEWVRCSLFGKRGETLSQYLVKGTKVTVFGEMATRSFQGNDGQTRHSVECKVEHVVLQGGGEPRQAAPVQQQANQAPVISDDIPF